MDKQFNVRISEKLADDIREVVRLRKLRLGSGYSLNMFLTEIIEDCLAAAPETTTPAVPEPVATKVINGEPELKSDAQRKLRESKFGD